MKIVGFIVNPVAGMGGRIGLKGTNGEMYKRAVELGAVPVSPLKAQETMKIIYDARNELEPIKWLTCSGVMGADILRNAGFPESDYSIVYDLCSPHSMESTKAEDTKSACIKFKEMNVNLILFCGGDGTARDVYDSVGMDIPILGIPAGVKMHSGVFGMNTRSTAEIVIDFLNDRIGTNSVEIMDIDEEKYRKGIWTIKLYGYAQTPYESNYIQSGKMMIEEGDEEIKKDISEYMNEIMEKEIESIFILGPGSTVETVGERYGIEKTLLGIDIVYQNQLLAKDVDEKTLLFLLLKYKSAKLILSPIGAQGFILGRGNLQLSPDVIKKIGIDNIIVISTPSKLARTPVLRVDTGDESLDLQFSGRRLFVINGYHSLCLREVVV